jgi:hypothetical protein
MGRKNDDSISIGVWEPGSVIYGSNHVIDIMRHSKIEDKSYVS